MKHMKRIVALLLATVMVMAMSMSAMAAQGEQTLDTSISVSGLEEGDTVDFYQVLEFDQNAKTTGGWKAAAGFTTLTTGEIQTILALDATGKPVTITDDNKDSYGISAALAAKIANMAKTATKKYTKTADGSGVAKQDTPVAGLYLGLISPAKTGFIYNPVFMGADYKNNTTNNIEAVITKSYSPASMAKKVSIPLEKTAEDRTRTIDQNKQETISAGDDIVFTVKTTIPKFADNYTNPVFKVSDALSTGLTLDQNSIKVYKDSVSDANLLTPSTTYDATTTTATSFVLNFKKDYIKGLTDNQVIYITYEAKLTSDAEFSVNPEDNTVTVNYSNKPTDEEGHGLIKDKTNHYTFDIDGNLLGEAKDSWKTTEVIKVGVDADGKEITKTVVLHEDTDQKAGALEGAEFELYTDQACTTKYTNSILTDTKKIVSDATGRMTIQGETEPGIRGLDAGVYYLKETKAPAGYIAAQDPVKIEIIPTITQHTKTETVKIDGVDTEVTYKYNQLDSYIVKMNGETTADYTITNQGDGTWKSDKRDIYTGAHGAIGSGTAGEGTGKVINTEGVQLPSTGGMGTTMFYVVGSALVIGAAVLLISKRRMAR